MAAKIQQLPEDQTYGLVVLETGKAQNILFKYVVMNLNYRYGMGILKSDNVNEAAGVMRASSAQIRCLFIVQKEQIRNKMFIYALTLQGKRPLFFLCPTAILGAQKQTCEGLSNVYFCAWETAFKSGDASLNSLITAHVKEGDLDELLDEPSVPYEQLQKQVENRVSSLQTLPAIPEIVMRIMRLVQDPDCNVEQLEQLLLNDPSIVQKLLQVVSSPVFAGAAKTGKWTLKEAIVRMGLKKAGAIAQQVKLMNTFIKPEDSNFDLRRFWEHSIGCAVIAEKICTDKLVPFEREIPFDTYWISSILHDIGKMILGLFFWEHFENVIGKMAEGEEGLLSFREAETQIGDQAHHERVGEILLMKSGVLEELVDATRSHHTLTENSSDLTALLFLVNNLSKDLGLGYLPDEVGQYPEELLNLLKISTEDLEKLKENMTEEVVPHIKDVVELCLSS